MDTEERELLTSLTLSVRAQLRRVLIVSGAHPAVLIQLNELMLLVQELGDAITCAPLEDKAFGSSEQSQTPVAAGMH